MDPILFISIITALISSIAAVLAWVAKIRWADEYKEAKEAQIDLLEREIQSYREMTSDPVRKHFLNQKQDLEDIINTLQSTIEAKNNEMATTKGKSDAEIAKLKQEKKHLQSELENVKNYSTELSTISGAYDHMAARYGVLYGEKLTYPLGVDQFETKLSVPGGIPKGRNKKTP